MARGDQFQLAVLSARFAVVAVALASAAAEAAPDIGLGDGHWGSYVAPDSGSPIILNAYAGLVGNAAAGSSALTVATIVGFSAGNAVLVHQTKGLPLPDAGDQGPFNLSASGTGHYEFARLASVSPGTLVLTQALATSFPAGVSQVVQVPEYSQVSIPGGAWVQAGAWDGGCGGILAFVSSGPVAVNGLVSAGGQGFRPGACVLGGGTGCTALNQAPPQGARKGEGVAAGCSGATCSGRGNLSSGGGGGACQNSGGGGGGNGGIGGIGGRSDNTDGDRAVGGMGGARMAFASPGTLVFGGGGGAGHSSGSGVVCGGGAGGGAVLIRGASLTGFGMFHANGAVAPPSDSQSQGGGGGGAGGTIELIFAGAATCSIASAQGGGGGDTIDLGTVGPGGGGAGGAIYLQAAGNPACATSAWAGVAGILNGGGYVGAEPTSATGAPYEGTIVVVDAGYGAPPASGGSGPGTDGGTGGLLLDVGCGCSQRGAALSATALVLLLAALRRVRRRA